MKEMIQKLEELSLWSMIATRLTCSLWLFTKWSFKSSLKKATGNVLDIPQLKQCGKQKESN
jgi:hypothetical protein